MDHTVQNWVGTGWVSGYRSWVGLGFSSFIIVVIGQVLQMCARMYDAIMQLRQPECQVIWGILSQQYARLITVIPYACPDAMNSCEVVCAEAVSSCTIVQ